MCIYIFVSQNIFVRSYINIYIYILTNKLQLVLTAVQDSVDSRYVHGHTLYAANEGYRHVQGNEPCACIRLLFCIRVFLNVQISKEFGKFMKKSERIYGISSLGQVLLPIVFGSFAHTASHKLAVRDTKHS